MTAYWLLFALPALLALAQPAPTPTYGRHWPAAWWAVFFVLVAVIGLRHEVGGDWEAYLGHLETARSETFWEAAAGKDPAYSLLNWLVSRFDGRVHAVNSVCALIFAVGLVHFCRIQPRAWLALVVAIPYLVIVVAMGYTRQGTAIGLVMLALVALTRGQTLRFVVWIALASTFHKSAVILVPLALLAGSERRLLTVVWVLLAAVALFFLMLQESIDNLAVNYIGREYESQGAGVRVAMNALPAVIFLTFRRRFNLLPRLQTFWTWMAAGAIFFILLLAVSPSSTAVDRVALYWIPLQIFVLARLPEAIGRPAAKENNGWAGVIILYSALVLFVWLVFGAFSYTWLPYRFYPVELLLSTLH